MKRVLLLIGIVAACGSSPARVGSVSASGSSITVSTDRPLRAIRLDLSWDASLQVSGIALGPDDARLDLLRVDLKAGGARVLVSDSRGVKLPQAGTLLTVASTGTGAIRIDAVQAADDAGLVTVTAR